MDHFFVSRDKVRRYFEPVPGLGVDGLTVLRRKGSPQDGTPFFLGRDMRPVEPLCSFMFEMAKTHQPKTLSDYTYDLLDLVDFLAQLEPSTDVLSATEEDLIAYRAERTELQDKPNAPATWKRRRALINNFYEWAVEAQWLDRKPYRRLRNGRDVLAWGAVSDLDIRHLTHRQWRFLKQVGLRGMLPADRVDLSFRGSAPLRNAAAAELAVTTGMRLREFTSLLDIEVGIPRRDCLPVDVRLEMIAKYSLPRDVTIQHSVMKELDLYRRTERAATIRRAAPALTRRGAELFVVTDIDERQMKVSGRLHGRRRTFSIEKMTAELRRIAVTEGPCGLEPMALFVGRGGRMLSKQRWEQIFDDAHARSLRIAAENGVDMVMPRRFRIHDLRHTFSVYMLEQLTQLVIAQETDRRLNGGHNAYLADHICRNPQLILQRLLGHLNPGSTMKYLRYVRNTNVLVAQAIAEWNESDKTYAEYAALAAERAVL
ncbi:site-specific recombinase XerD [Saccharomonospora marina XMU15]|uniref:Site-specific recombinase XerD n=1 Tax=Saccharomonospora marina XMU15 TaxID=882083 RepID=H5WY84_9PSEU|nr:site-specific integrase [Saccharomonospora marina]EHR48417.1 site-specific recombinase XerD [Saccharomonospora marina XMU15]